MADTTYTRTTTGALIPFTSGHKLGPQLQRILETRLSTRELESPALENLIPQFKTTEWGGIENWQTDFTSTRTCDLRANLLLFHEEKNKV